MSMIHTIRGFAAAAAIATTVIVATGVVANADPYERWIYVNNVGADFVIEELYITHVGMDTWGYNLLAGYDVYPGEYALVEPDLVQGYCRFDVLMVFDDGYEMMLPRVNLCEAFEIYTDGYDYDVVYI